VRSPNTWNQHSAPLFHRAMADAHITLSYVLQEDSMARAQEFSLFGLGQEKLAIAHLEARCQGREPGEQEAQLLDARRRWLESQRHELLTQVNLGSHTGLSTRAMAEKSDKMGLYNFNFTPFSACVHSTWQHIARFNLIPCTNPLHGGHRVGVVAELENGLYEVWLALKNLKESLLMTDAFMAVTLPVESWSAFQPFLNQPQET
jgi:hypothetical protein